MLLNHTRSILLYSQFGAGKTSLLAELAARILLGRSLPMNKEELESFMEAVKASPYRMRLVTAEHTDSIQSIVDTGLIEVWKISNRPYPFETLRAAADGYWPKNPLDPESPLEGPTAATWERYPIRAWEGLATLSNYIGGSSVVGSLANRIGDGEKIGPTDSGELIRFEDGGAGIGALSRSNYGMVQKEMTSIVQRAQKRNGYVFFTTHEDDVKEKKGGVMTGRTVSGPEVFGGALTTVIGREFGNVWHISTSEQVVQDAAGNERVLVDRRLYVKNHVNGGVVYLAKHSGGKQRDSQIPDYFSMTKDGQPLMDVAERVINKIGLVTAKEVL